ncbi:MAG TPA: acetate kinase [Mycobacterium sp.]|nr:acetate kinase [Mycobacterium sp.]HUH70208.1 acetate kinase [Mycobacterium sp.]
MSDQVLVINSGSSSIKYQFVDPVSGTAVASGLVERIGEAEGRVQHHYDGNTLEHCGPIVDHTDGFGLAYAMFAKSGLGADESPIKAVGHRVVHGGRLFHAPTLINDAVLAEIERLSELAPLHNPPNAIGIAVTRKQFPNVPHVAVFDTGFFHSLPGAAATYAISHDIAEAWGVRRYGFHGTSHEYVSREAAHFLDRDFGELKTIVLHLGNGASASAVRKGHAVETSMGLTPLEGLVMGTRGGDIDPGILTHLNRAAGMDFEQLDRMLNKMSGLKGMCGVNDFRELFSLIESDDAGAKLAYEVYVHRIRKYVGAYLAVLGGADAIVFTAGVGENVAAVREDALSDLDSLGIQVDPLRNQSPQRGPRVISSDDSRVAVLVIPTNEELAIARAAWQFV